MRRERADIERERMQAYREMPVTMREAFHEILLHGLCSRL
jgi:hypothetical protein